MKQIALSIQNATFSYNKEEPVFIDITFQIKKGEMLVLTGSSGCGKSSLIRCILGIHKLNSGQILVHGKSIASIPSSEFIKHIAFVSQKPQEQILCERLDDEVAFSMESVCMNPKEMKIKIQQLLEEAGLSEFTLDHPTYALSGGQTQRLMTSAARAADAKILILDEALAHLDQRGSRELLTVLRRFCERGGTVLIVEHRLHDVLDMADQVLVMNEDKTYTNFILPPTDEIWQHLQNVGLRIPLWMGDSISRSGPRKTSEIISIPSVCYHYPTISSQSPTLDMACIHISKGDKVFVVGENGAGKSTYLKILGGDIKIAKPVLPNLSKIYVPQDADLMLFCDSVEDELLYGAREFGYEFDAREMAAKLGLLKEFEQAKAPYELSRGQRLRLAIGAALSVKPDILLLDEPTSGQDFSHIKDILDLLCEDSHFENMTILLVTHDVELAIQYADEIWVLDSGKRVFCGSPTEPTCSSFLMNYKDIGWISRPSPSAESNS